jgi:hypothetical protein
MLTIPHINLGNAFARRFYTESRVRRFTNEEKQRSMEKKR